MMIPKLLSNNDRVAMIAPAGKLPERGIDKAVEILDSWSLNVVPGKHVFSQDGYFAGTDLERLSDLQNAINDPTIAAILMARGGYGITRILDRLDLNPLKKSPKWLIGFSDITALHLRMAYEGLVSIHGDVGTSMGQDADSTEALHQLLFKGISKIDMNDVVRQGSGIGELVGGNLSLIVDSLGTYSEIQTDNKILFIEEIGEKTYRIDRMMNQLFRANKLSKLAGLVVGHFTDITESNSEFGFTWRQSILDLVEDFDYPVVFGLPVGHEPQNYPIVHGGTYEIRAQEEIAQLVLKSS